MTTRFGRETWTILVPDGWEAWHNDECATLVAGDEIGALQISAAFKESAVLDEDLMEFAAEHLAAGAKTKAAVCGDFTGFEIAFSAGEVFWRHWYLRHGRQMLYVTYNCELALRGQEDAAVQAMLSSLAAVGQA
jgi:hypothetical protein